MVEPLFLLRSAAETLAPCPQGAAMQLARRFCELPREGAAMMGIFRIPNGWYVLLPESGHV